MKTILRGHDEMDAAINAVTVTVVGFIALAMAVDGTLWAWWAWLACTLVTPIIYFGTRYQLQIAPTGIMLTKSIAGVPWRRTHWFLDSRLEPYDTWESDRAEGVYLRSSRVGEFDCTSFGPTWDPRMVDALCHRANEAIVACRDEVSHPRPLRIPGLSPDAFEVCLRSPGGAPREVRNTRPIPLLGVTIPTGSTFELNVEGWVDPARSDTITTITVSTDTRLDGDLLLPAGGRLLPGKHERFTCMGLDAPLMLASLPIDGQRPVTFERGAKVAVQFTLAEPHELGGILLPTGTTVQDGWFGGWHASVGGPLELPDLSIERGDSIDFDADWQPRLLHLHASRIIETRGWRVEGWCLPLRGDATIDERKCDSGMASAKRLRR